MFLSLLLLIIFIPIQKIFQDTAGLGQKVPIVTATKDTFNTHLIYEETFEGNSYFPLTGNTINKTHAIENCATDWALSRVTDPVFQGHKACRFETRKDQELVGAAERIRSEVTIIKADEDERFTPDMWYSFSVLFPSKEFKYNEKRDCFNQWFEDGSRETTLRTEKDRAYLEVAPPLDSPLMMRYDLFSSRSGTKGNIDSFDIIPKDQWHEFVFHFIHSKGEDGLIEVWRDGVKIHRITGRNMHLKYPKWKIGLYSSIRKYTLDSKAIYFDNIRVGNASATFADMTSISKSSQTSSTSSSASSTPNQNH